MKLHKFITIIGAMLIGVFSYQFAKEIVPIDFAWNPLPSYFLRPIDSSTLSLLIMVGMFAVGYIILGISTSLISESSKDGEG